MLLSIILVSIIASLLFLTALISLIAFIINSTRKNPDSQRRSIKILIPSAVIWIVLMGVDIFLIVTYLYNNGGKILDITLEKSSEIVSKGLVLTAQNFEKNWDTRRLSQLENLSITLESIEHEIDEDIKRYKICFIFDNKSPIEVKLYFSDLLGNNYLFACDKNEFVYFLELEDWTSTVILPGKSRYNFRAEVPKDIEIEYIRYVNQKIRLE